MNNASAISKEKVLNMRLILEGKMLSKLIVVALMAITLCMAHIAVASDPNAPPWRGSAGSTFEEWGFNTNSNPAAPETVSNPYGMPSAVIDYERPFGSGWKNSIPAVYGAAQGWWDIARGSIALSIINHPYLGYDISKDIQVQVVYWKDINDAPTVLVTPTAIQINKTTTLVASGPTGGAWYLDLWIFHVNPNMNSEVITVKGHPTAGSQIDRIVVDTRYTEPPPTTVDFVCTVTLVDWAGGDAPTTATVTVDDVLYAGNPVALTGTGSVRTCTIPGLTDIAHKIKVKPLKALSQTITGVTPQAFSCQCGDNNDDNKIDDLDFLRVIGNFGKPLPDAILGDGNGDEKTDDLDFLRVIGNFGGSGT
jgi:hypothetical protein